MARIDFLEAYRRTRSKRVLPEQFFDMMQGYPVLYFFTPYELSFMRATIDRTDIDIRKKNEIIMDLMHSKQFRKLSGGTNRVVFYHPDFPGIVIKIGYDQTGIGDNLREMHNQTFLKPYVCKVFDVTADGMVAVTERVRPILSEIEFEANIKEFFGLVFHHLLGEYVAEDIGKTSFKNFGIREGFGPVLLDYPYFYKGDPNKFYCTHTNSDGTKCPGYIDYDRGINALYCSVCGRRYFASDLEDKNASNMMIKSVGGMKPMRVRVMQGDETLFVTGRKSDTIVTRKPKVEKENKLRVSIRREYSDGSFEIIKGAYDDDEPKKEAPRSETEQYEAPEAEVVKQDEPVQEEVKESSDAVPYTATEISDTDDSDEAPAEVNTEEDEKPEVPLRAPSELAVHKDDRYEKNRSKFTKNKKKGFKRDHYAYNPYDGGEY